VTTRSPSNYEMRVPKTAEVVASRLRGQIIRGELSVGGSLPGEAALTEQFNISRPTLREALRILESERLIEIRRGARGGARVLGPDPRVAAAYAGHILQSSGATLRDVFTARTVVEEPAITLIAQPPDAEQVAVLRANVEQYGALAEEPHANGERLIELSEDFHIAVLGLSGNPALMLFRSMVRDIVHQVNRRARTQAERERRPPDLETARAHGKLVDLLEAGNLLKANGLWRRHLVDVDRVLSERFADTEYVLDLLED
jgi:DNA-binding FadR family transcriptional regulator